MKDSILPKRTGKPSYKYSVFSDIVSNKTTTVETSNVYAAKSYSGSGGRQRIHYYPAYISCDRYESEATNTLVEIVNHLKLLEKTITIEYYNNSKIIKTIDGIGKFDYDKLKERCNYLTEQNQKMLEQEKFKETKN